MKLKLYLIIAFIITVCWLLSPGFASTIELFAGGGEAEDGRSVSPVRTRLDVPFGVDFDRGGNCYILEYRGHKIIRVAPDGETTVFAGTGEKGFGGDGGPATGALFCEPHGLLISRDQQVYVADTHNNRVRKIDLASGVISTIAGTGMSEYGGDGGPAVQAKFRGVYALALNEEEDLLYVADLHDSRIRMIHLSKGIISTVAGNGRNGIPQDGEDAISEPIGDPRSVAVDSKGNVYFIERRGNALRKVDANGKIWTLISNDMPLIPKLNLPKHISVDESDQVIIADAENHLIRIFNPLNLSTVTVAGTGARGSEIVSNQPLMTGLNRPHGVVVHPSGDIYISDSYNHRILRLNR